MRLMQAVHAQHALLLDALDRAGPHFFCKNDSAPTPACLRMARNVPSGMSPGWLGMVVYRFSAALNQISRARSLAVELQAELLEPPDDVAVLEARQRTHQVATISG